MSASSISPSSSLSPGPAVEEESEREEEYFNWDSGSDFPADASDAESGPLDAASDAGSELSTGPNYTGRVRNASRARGTRSRSAMPTKAVLEQTIAELRLASREKDAKLEDKALRVEELEVELERTKKSLRRALAEGATLKNTAHNRQEEVDSARSVRSLCDHSSHLATQIGEALDRNKGWNELDTRLLIDLVEVLKSRLGQVEDVIGPFTKFQDAVDSPASSSCKVVNDGLSLKRPREDGPGEQLQITDGHDTGDVSSSSKRQKTATASSSKRELRRQYYDL
eukprot:g14208.t1